MKFSVVYTHVIEREVTCIVEANTPEEAIQKAKAGEIEDDDDEFAPEQGIETKDYHIVDE